MEAKNVELTAVVSYYEWEWRHTLQVVVSPKPLTEAEQIQTELEQMIAEKEVNARREQRFQLPLDWNGKEIRWKEKKNDNCALVVALTIVTAIAIFFLKDRDLHAQVDKRQQQLKKVYPMLVNKLVLYLGAGMTIHGAFHRIAEGGLKKAGSNELLYEEMWYTCRELQTGIAENQAYERFGVRCGLQEYIRFGALLSQNLKKGSDKLLVRLREEADGTMREQIDCSRKIGEEASTKLLLPMIMMLIVVMIMIMVPAFGTI